jgi:hypothetical protein
MSGAPVDGGIELPMPMRTGELVEVMRDFVLRILIALSEALGEEPPVGLELGDRYAVINRDGGGDHVAYTGVSGETHRWHRPFDANEFNQVMDARVD